MSIGCLLTLATSGPETCTGQGLWMSLGRCMIVILKRSGLRVTQLGVSHLSNSQCCFIAASAVAAALSTTGLHTIAHVRIFVSLCTSLHPQSKQRPTSRAMSHKMRPKSPAGRTNKMRLQVCGGLKAGRQASAALQNFAGWMRENPECQQSRAASPLGRRG